MINPMHFSNVFERSHHLKNFAFAAMVSYVSSLKKSRHSSLNSQPLTKTTPTLRFQGTQLSKTHHRSSRTKTSKREKKTRCIDAQKTELRVKSDCILGGISPSMKFWGYLKGPGGVEGGFSARFFHFSGSCGVWMSWTFWSSSRPANTGPGWAMMRV